MEKNDIDKDKLTIGDYIILKDVIRLGFLSVEGILLEEIFCVEDLSLIQDAVFCVHLQRQYSASRDLHAFLENYGMDPRKIEDEGAKRYFQALEV
jgi:hypothetical protein